MRLLMISPMYPSEKDPVYGTFIRTYYDNFVSLEKDGVVDLVCIRGRSNNLLVKVIKYLVFYLQILYYLLFRSYDIVYVQTITTPILPVKLVSIFKNIDLVFNVHGSDVITITKTNEYLKRMSTPLLYKARMIVAPSKYFKCVLMKNFPGLSASKIYISPSGGVDLKKFYTSNTHKSVLTIGYVSRIDFGKGWDTFLSAISLLKKEGFNVCGIMAGRGTEQNSMLKMIRDLDIEDIIEYVGPVPHDELPNFFHKMDVFVFPTKRSESLGLVGVEALACGVPVIGTNYAALPEYISEGCNGYLFNLGDLHELCEKIEMYIGLNKSEKERMSVEARMSSMKFDTDVVMNSLYEKLNELSK